MKRKIIIAVSLLMLTSFTACGGGSGEAAPENDTAPAAVQTEAVKDDADTSEETETEEDVIEDIPEEEIPDDDVEDETEDDADSSETDDGLFHGRGYTLAVDSSKWMDFSEYIEMLSSLVDKVDTGFDVSAEQFMEAGDGLFYYSADPEINVNIIKNEIGFMGDDLDFSLVAPMVESQYNAVEGYSFLGSEVIDLNGNKCLYVDVAVTGDAYGLDEDMKMSQYMFMHGADQYVITYTAKQSKYDVALEDFKIMLNTLKFDD